MADTATQPPPPSTLAREIGRGVTAAVMLIAVAQAGFFARALPPTALETAAQGAGPAYSALRAVIALLGNDSTAAMRGVSVLCLAGSIAATAWLGQRASGDAPVGAFLALGWILFPPVIGVQALATPIAATGVLVTVALACLWPGAHRIRGQDGAGALALMLAALLGPVGAWAALAAVVLLLILRPRLWTLLAPALGAGLAIAATAAAEPSPLGGDAGWTPAGRDGVLFGAVLPFAMIWVGSVLAAVASRAGLVKRRLGTAPVAVCRAAPVVFAGLVLLGGRATPHPDAAYLAAGTVFLPISLVGILPLVVWVRVAMPRIKALAAWIAFPVVMYSCFWVVLWPIKGDRFPYRQTIGRPAPETGKSGDTP